MQKIYSFFTAIFLISVGCIAQTTTINLGTTNVEAKNIYTATDLPWEVKYGPGDSLWMTTRNGNVYRIHPESGNSTLLLNHSAAVTQSGESGMLGMAFHPSFAANPFVYIVYTYLESGNIKEKLSRFTYGNNSLTNETVLLENITGNTTHDGSRLLMLADNTLLMTTGDAQDLTAPQNLSSLSGKVLRLNLDGTIPNDNPFSGSYVYSFGHRNGQGLMQHPNGKIYETEHGPNSNDEFQIIEPGRNYGWPDVYGFCDNDINGEITFCNANNVKEPLASWNVVPGGTWAPNDLIWYNSSAIPEFENSFLVTFLKTSKIRRIKMNAAGDAIVSQTDFFVNEWGRLRDITTAPNGDIFLATNSSPFRIIRIRNLTVVPILFEKINARCNLNNVEVTFTASATQNVQNFKLYTSNDGINFIKLLNTAAVHSVANTYVFNVPKTFMFYKIESVDIAGEITVSTVQKIKCLEKIPFKILPNPANAYVELFTASVSQPFLVQVFNMMGAKVFEKTTNKNTIIALNGWPIGLYVFIVKNNDGNIVFTEKLRVN